MIISLENTTTRHIAAQLIEAQEHYTLTTGRVLTLIVMAHADENLESLLDAVRDASHEHPSRLLVVRSGDPQEETRLDAELRVGGEAGASEMVVMHLHGDLTDHAEAVVTPLLLPDTPIVAWWPSKCPPAPAQHPIGVIAQRRITNIAADGHITPQDLQKLSEGYAPGDSDMTWAALTLWRGVVASALDRPPHEPVESVEITAPEGNPAADFAAGWLLDALAVPVVRRTEPAADEEAFPITSLRFHRADSYVEVAVVDKSTLRVQVPGSPESLVSLSKRSQAEILSEELRHLDADKTYAHALRALDRVGYSE
ncbi:glucose-6-phosphate dehydrogenase assembly protein OpcA [Corynebacterium camporealensis]|uniref:glucose-6-phosphate dehydrogenase assembly protein OpcA n=1 Tax=Corynebacterium camporealensis TaxID=161896 RepID=UPI0034CE33C8